MDTVLLALMCTRVEERAGGEELVIWRASSLTSQPGCPTSTCSQETTG
jgi:hypothetical protein